MRVRVLCESSGIVRDAFRFLGHHAESVDLLASERPGPHRRTDCRALTDWADWDLIIAHPPCTDLAVSGARWFPAKRASGAQQAAIEFVRWLVALPVPRLCVENPVSILSTHLRRPDQVIQPWQFGHGEVKATCLWLDNLPRLRPTLIVSGRDPRIWRLPPGPDRGRERSRTYPGIAAAMAAQWGGLPAGERYRQPELFAS